MRFFLKTFLSLTLAFATFSCIQKPAQIIDNSKKLYGKSGVTKGLRSYNARAREGRITVFEGDTIFSISKKTQTPLRDLIRKNNLIPPYKLKAGTTLIVPITAYHEVQAGETLYAISRTYDMKINQLIEINNLEEPYRVNAGDRIKISNSESSQKSNYALKRSEESPPKKTSGVVERVLGKSNKFSWPINGAIISKFGPKSAGLYNDGVNIQAKEGSIVKASESGVVAYVGNELKGYGNLVIIKHSEGWITAYAHLAKTTVSRGEKVDQGQQVGLVGATGNVLSPQLYFGLRKGRDAVNPERYLK